MDRKRALELAEEELFSIEEACEFLDIGATKLYELNKDRVIPYVRVGRIRKIPKKALQEYVADLLQKIN